MYWLLDDASKAAIRATMTSLVTRLSTVTGSVQDDQLFPFVGRKDRRKARLVIEELAPPGSLMIDPFSGSGIFAYAAAELGRSFAANEWEPYTHRMSSAPWQLPAKRDIDAAKALLVSKVKAELDDLYRTICVCGQSHVLDSLFFDRVPLRFVGITPHERLGAGGENVTYRGAYKCPNCGAKEKRFDSTDQAHLDDVQTRVLATDYVDLFNTRLIPNSRINLSGSMTTYGNLFPHRSKLALAILWDGINSLAVDPEVRRFLQDAFLATIPLAKFKDYRSKSQDLHPPDVQLRESNLLFRLIDQINAREAGLRRYSFSSSRAANPIATEDFRAFLDGLPDRSVKLVFTDPPWTDGNPYFEKAQLYHPWLGYQLSTDVDRLDGEVVVTDAPSRKLDHDLDRWWRDISSFFERAGRVTEDLGFLALFFRPTPARKWLETLNRLKLIARKAGFEPLLSIDASSADPSMRIQQSASFAFATDIVFVFLKVPAPVSRHFEGEVDLDHLSFLAAMNVQEDVRQPYSRNQWAVEFGRLVIENEVPQLNLPRFADKVSVLFERYNKATPSGLFLPRADTPFSGQLFDVPAIERLFTYVPLVVKELTEHGSTFTYDLFLLKLAEYVENGTRMLIKGIQDVDMRSLLLPYAVPLQGGRVFQKATIPTFPQGIAKLMELDPYQFEAFSASLLERQGFTNVVLMGRSGDRGVDIAAEHPEGGRVVVQCKRYIGNVGSEPIQRLHSFSVTRGSQRRIVITTSDFTADGRDEARRTNTELVNGAELESLIARFMPELMSPE